MYALAEMLQLGLPWFGVTREVAIWRLRNLPNFWRGFWRIALARLLGLATIYGQVSILVRRSSGEIEDYGIASLRVITFDGVQVLADTWLSTNTIANMKYHGFGSGAVAENSSDSALQTEFTSEYPTVRPTGSLVAVPTFPIVKSIATFTPVSAVAVTEHGIFDTSTIGAGKLYDRSKFSAVNLNGAGDSVQLTYQCTFVEGG